MMKNNKSKSLFEKTKPAKFRERIHKDINRSVEDFLKSKPEFEDVPCPFCHSNSAELYFNISRMEYLRCDHCNSIYNSPRLTSNSLNRFYELQPAKLVDNEMLPAVKQIRIEAVMKPRWELLRKKLEEQGVGFPVSRVIEVGAGMGHFIEVLQDTAAAELYVAVEPASACQFQLQQLKNTEVVCSNLEDVPPSYETCDLMFLNSVIEHPSSLDQFFQSAGQLLKIGSIISLVDMHSGGFDIELLRAEAQNVNPFFILQIGSRVGVKELVKRNGFELIDEFSIGQMDIDIIYDFATGLDISHPLYGLRYLLSDKTLRGDLQRVLQEHLATGYMGYLLKKVI
jgi:SAM-dependent methyltransferase